MSDLDHETNNATSTFEFFGREWTVPTRRHHVHIRRSKEILRSEGRIDADDIAAIYLSPEQYDELVDLDVDEDGLDEFATRIAESLGLVNSGNSAPSASSS